ncbi:hypothetical protein D3C72_1596040 [compost metagenome]
MTSPIRPTETRPAMGFSSILRSGVAVSCTSAPARSTVNCTGSPLLMATTPVTSPPSAISLPLTRVIRSPGRNPAAAAGESGCTCATRAGRCSTPTRLNNKVKMKIASTKLAKGPPATTRARCHTGLKYR